MDASTYGRRPLAPLAAATTFVALALATLSACTESDNDRTDPGPPPTSAATSPAPGPEPTPASVRQQVRAVLRQAVPAADDVIALAKVPASWTAGEDRLLLEYRLMPPSEWPYGQYTVALQTLDANGRLLAQTVDPGTKFGSGIRKYYPAGRAFVGITSYGPPAGVLIRDDGVDELATVRGSRVAGPGDVPVGPGWLLDQATMTLTRERLGGCQSESIRNDLRDRVWCLDPEKTTLAWSDDRGDTWTRHRLSASYFEYCDGGTLGADLAVHDTTVAIGLWRADFSHDRGETWSDVDLPYRLVGAHPGQAGSEANCAGATPLVDGRLVLDHFGAAMAADPTNTKFAKLRTPDETQYAGVEEGLLTAASKQPYGTRLVSYDAGRTWQPPRAEDLVRHVLGEFATR